MSRGLQWQVLNVSLAGGIETREDVRSADPRQMDIARDVQFDEFGGVQTRFPFTALSSNIFGGGTIANARRLEANGDELVLFTDTQAYSWNAQLSVWVPRGTHLAVAVDEVPRFVTPGDQIDGDRAELNGTVITCWTEGGSLMVAAHDKTTGSVLVTPAIPAFLTGATRPRVVAASTKILLFYVLAGGLFYNVIDPANPSAGINGGGTACGTSVAGPFDVVKVEGQDLVCGAAARTPATTHNVFYVSGAGVLTLFTKARTCDGPIAVSTTVTTGVQLQVVRASGTNILGDVLTTSTLADVVTNESIGTATSTTINQIAACFISANVVQVFWTSGSIGETSSFTDFTVKFNTVTGAVPGTQATFRHRLGIASRAFTYAGHAYVWLTFASDSGTTVTGNTPGVRAQLQNTYFLYRDDATVHSRCTFDVGGGFASTLGRLPGVALVSGSTGFAWCATSRRRIDLGGQADHTGFGSRSPRDVTFTFDSNTARRCARIGATMYVASGIPLQYDGVTLAEVGFLYYPWFFDPQIGAAGNIAAGTYTWKATMRWNNAQGELDRSTTATGMSQTLPSPKFIFMNYHFLNVTMKTAPRPPAIDFWRTTVAPLADSPFYLVSSQDPNAGIVDNGYVQNDDLLDAGTPLPDNFADATLITKETNVENGSVLEFLAPPGASIIFTTDTRVFLAGVDGDPDSVWYSRLRGVGEVASFHDSLVIPIPPAGGAITAIAFLNETLVVFRETCIYALPGVGFDNLGQGSNFGPANRLSSDVGAVVTESVALTPLGLIFKSRKGWYLVLRSWECKYIGANAAAFDGDTVFAVHVIETMHEVRILTNARMIVWDYIAVTEGGPLGQWAERTIADGLHATVWNGSYVYLTTSGPKIEATTYSGVNYGLDVESSWIKLQDLQGAARVRWLEVLGEFRSSCLIRIRVARDYQYDGAGNALFFDDVAWSPSPTVVGSALQMRHALTQGQSEAIKVRITAVTAGSAATMAAPTVQTSGADWAATWRAAASRPGDSGNVITMSLAFEDGSPFSIDVREHFAWSHALQRWREDLFNVGVRVLCRTGSSPTVAQLEAAIIAGATLVTLLVPDATPSKIVGASGMVNLTSIGAFNGGVYGVPTGEACKLTGLGLEVGLSPGLYRRLPAAQKA